MYYVSSLSQQFPALTTITQIYTMGYSNMIAQRPSIFPFVGSPTIQESPRRTMEPATERIPAIISCRSKPAFVAHKA